MGWWNRNKDPTGSKNFNPATDEVSLDRCLRRLREILDECTAIGTFLEEVGERVRGERVKSGANPDEQTEEEWLKRAATELQRIRVAGFCGYKLAVEAWTLMELIAVRVANLRILHQQTGNREKLRKLDQIQSIAEEAEPMLRQTVSDMEIFSSLEGKKFLETIIKRFGPRAT